MAYNSKFTGAQIDALLDASEAMQTSKENVANKVTSLAADATDEQYPSAKAVSNMITTVVENISKKNAIGVYRGKVTYSGGVVTVGKGNYYFYNQYGKEYTKAVYSDLTFSLSSSQPYLVYNHRLYNFYARSNSSLLDDDIVCLFYDGANGICGGQWYSYSKNSLQDESLKKLSSYEKTQLIGLSSEVDGNNIITNFFEVKNGDVVRWTSYISTTNNSLFLYDSAKTIIDRWPAPSNTREVTIENENAAYVRVSFCQKQLYSDQVLLINGAQKAKYGAVKEDSAGVAYFCNAKAEVDTATRVVTIKAGSDIYSTVRNKTRFYRFQSDYSFTFDSDGTNNVVYNNSTKELYCNGGGALLDNDIFVVGVRVTHRLFLNGDITITYSNGAKSKSLYTYEDIKSIANQTSIQTIPSFVLEDGRATYRRMMDWAQGDELYTLAQVTDVHSAGSEKYKVLEWLDSLNDLYGFNVIANFGDIGLDTSETNGDKAKSFALIENTKRYMRGCNPWIFLKGNHERLENGIVANNGMYGSIFNRPLAKNKNNITLSEDGCYGYIDDVRTKTRFIFTNSSDTGYYYGFTNAQLQFVIDSIMSAADGYKIIVGSHYCIDEIGRWTSYPDECVGSSAMRAILKSAANHTAGSAADKGLSWDFSSKTNVKLVCSIAGDSHFNNYVKRDGVNYIVRQGYGGVSDSEMPDGATKDSFTWNSICNFDVLAVKSNGEAKVFRIGIGGEARDVKFTY